MKKLQWMPVLLTAAAMSVTAYAQDQASESDAYEAETEASANVELNAGDERDTHSDSAQVGADQSSDWEAQADTAQSSEDKSSEAQLSSTESGDAGAHDWKEFSAVDEDGNGLLGIEEAKGALPEHMAIVDTNDDGVLNREEAEAAMPEVSFTSGNPNEPVGPNDYETIRQQLESVSGAPSPGVDQSPDDESADQAQPADEEEAQLDASGDLG